MKEGIFVGSKPRKVLKDPNFEKKLPAVERRAWKVFEWLCANFLGNTISPLLQEEVKNLHETYKEMGCHVPLKVHFYTHI